MGNMPTTSWPILLWKKLRSIFLGQFPPTPQSKWDTWTTKHINFLFPFNPYFAPSISSLTHSKSYSQTHNRPLQFQSCVFVCFASKIPKPQTKKKSRNPGGNTWIQKSNFQFQFQPKTNSPKYAERKRSNDMVLRWRLLKQRERKELSTFNWKSFQFLSFPSLIPSILWIMCYEHWWM